MGSTNGKTPGRLPLARAWHLLLACMLGACAGSALAAGASAVAAPPGHPASASAKKPAPAAPAKLVNLNSASRKDLKALPGVDDALADKIIAGRPFLTKADLVTKGVMLEGPYLALKNRVVAGQKNLAKPKPAGKPASAAATGGKS